MKSEGLEVALKWTSRKVIVHPRVGGKQATRRARVREHEIMIPNQYQYFYRVLLERMFIFR